MTGLTRYLPDSVSSPGETLQEILTERNLTQADLAERTGRPKKTINEIVQGKAPITPETAIQLQRVLNVSAQFWLQREAIYRAFLAEQQDDIRLESQTVSIKDFPIKRMIEYGWLDATSEKLSQIKAILSFFGVTSVDKVPLTEAVAFRRSEAFATNPWALAAWLRKGELEAVEQQCVPFNKSKLAAALPEMRKLTVNKPDIFVPRLTQLCNDCGIAISFVRELPKTNVSGATRWITSDLAHLQLSLRYKSNDHFWFSFFHEVGHIYLGHAKREILLENSAGASLDPREIEANGFASDVLVPPVALREFRKEKITVSSVQAFANAIDIAPGIVVGRLQHDKAIQFNELNSLKIALSWTDWPGDET